MSSGKNKCPQIKLKKRKRSEKRSKKVCKPDVVTPSYNLKCDFCNLRFKKHRLLNKHIIEKHSKNKYKCVSCKCKFATKITWYKHKRKHGENVLFCKKCKKGFQYNSSLK